MRNYLERFKIPSLRATKKLLLKYFITYFSVLLIPLLIGYAYYTKTLQILYLDAINENHAILKQITQVLNQRFEEADSIAIQIVSNSNVKAFQGVSDPFEYPNAYSIIRTRESLYNYSSSNIFIGDYFIFFNRSNIVMNDKITYPYKQFYNSYLCIEGLSYTDWYNQMNQKPSAGGISGEMKIEKYNGSYINPTQMTVITYTKPLISYGNNDGVVMILIDKNEIIKLLSSINTDDNGLIYIQNRNGDIITYYSSGECDITAVQAAVDQNALNENSSEILLDGKEMMVNQIKSSDNNFTCVAVQSKKVVLAKADNMKIILYIVLAISVLVGSFIAYYMARRSAKPLQDMLVNFKINGNSADIFENIKSTILDLGKSNSNLKNTINAQVPILRTTFLTRLINAEFDSQDEILNITKYIHLSCTDKIYCITIFKFDTDINNYDTLDLTIVSTFKNFLKDALDRVVTDALYCDLDEQQLVLLFEYPAVQKEQFKQNIEEVVSRLKQEVPQNVFNSLLISCGSIVTQLIDIPASFEKAKLAFKMNSVNMNSNILWYAETGNYTVNYFFPADMQKKLINNVKAGNKDSVKLILNTLFTQNFINSSLSTSLHKLFIYELLGNIISLGNQIGLDEKTYNYMINNMNNIEKYSELKQIKIVTDSYYALCDITNGQLDKQNINRVNQIVKYINDNYFDCNISLSSIAEKFNMNESYLSYVFKQQSGVKLSSYIENLRIKKAEELLKNSDLSISEISDKTGYLAANTFCRAFRRVTGINATTYRSGFSGETLKNLQ